MRKRRNVAYILALSMMCGAMPGTVCFANETEEPVLIEAESLGNADDNDGYLDLSYEIESAEVIQNYSLFPSGSGLPSSYNSGDYGYITSVKEQGVYGTCWAFAAINSAEADAIMDGRAEKDTVNYSEAQMAYFFYHRETDPLGGTAGDAVTNETTRSYLLIGGNNQLNTVSLASWMSPTEESLMPYEYVASYSTSNVSADYAYASTVAHLQNSYWVSLSDKDQIKQLVMDYGSVATSYYHSGNYFHQNQNGASYYYCPTQATQNHAVSIVGWDDTIPASYFTVTGSDGNSYTPSENGGWLIKNSYSTTWGSEGYFWISYEDGSLLNSTNMGVAYDFESADNYDNNYQYDGTVSLSRLQYQKDSCYNANIFTTQAEEDLKAVGFYTAQPGMKYEIQVYRNLKSGTPIGTAVFSQAVTGTEEYAGYHTVELPEAVSLDTGETFSIVIRYTDTSSGNVSFFIDRSINYGWLSCTSSNQTGQGYYSTDGESWKDCSEEYSANIRMKAFTDYRASNASVVPTTGITLNKTSCQLDVNGTCQLTAKVQPSNATNTNVVWTSSDSTVASVNSRGLITAKGGGTAVITARTKAGGYIATCQVTVYGQTQAFVSRLYNKCLGREEDAEGLKFWSQLLTAKERTGATVAYEFVFSEEYLNKNTTDEEYIEMLYQVFMNRASDASGFAYWQEQLNQGLSREYVFRGFVESQEYSDICNSYGILRGTITLSQPRDQRPELTKFVQRQYVEVLKRSGDADGINYWCQRILAGNMTPVQMTESFVNSEEFQNRNYSNMEYIKVLYRTFMGRDYDAAGASYWLQQMQQGMTREEVLHQFAGCPEFQTIVKSFGL